MMLVRVRGRRRGRATPQGVVARLRLRSRHRRQREVVLVAVRNLAVAAQLRGHWVLKPVAVVLARSVGKRVVAAARLLAKASMPPQRLVQLRRAAGPVAQRRPGPPLRLPRAEQRQQVRADRAARLRGAQMVAETTGLLRPSQDPAAGRS
jgi:hypothetical protein